jgi:hypothetical protein
MANAANVKALAANLLLLTAAFFIYLLRYCGMSAS